MVIIALYVYDVRKFRLRVLHYTMVEDRVLEDSVASGDRFLFFLSFFFFRFLEIVYWIKFVQSNY